MQFARLKNTWALSSREVAGELAHRRVCGGCAQLTTSVRGGCVLPGAGASAAAAACAAGTAVATADRSRGGRVGLEIKIPAARSVLDGSFFLALEEILPVQKAAGADPELRWHGRGTWRRSWVELTVCAA